MLGYLPTPWALFLSPKCPTIKMTHPQTKDNRLSFWKADRGWTPRSSDTDKINVFYAATTVKLLCISWFFVIMLRPFGRKFSQASTTRWSSQTILSLYCIYSLSAIPSKPSCGSYGMNRIIKFFKIRNLTSPTSLITFYILCLLDVNSLVIFVIATTLH